MFGKNSAWSNVPALLSGPRKCKRFQASHLNLESVLELECTRENKIKTSEAKSSE